MQMKMHMKVKKLVGAVAIVGAMGLPAFVSVGIANAAMPTPSISGPVQNPADQGSAHAQPVDWGDDDDQGGWGWGGWGDRGDWHDRGDWGDRGGWGWGWGWGR